MLFSTLWKALVLLPAAGLVNANIGAADMAKIEEKRILRTPPNNRMKLVRQRLHEANIIPTVIDDFMPILELRVFWTPFNASLGNELRPQDIQGTPSAHLDRGGFEIGHDAMVTTGLTYVIVMTDPDAPSRQDPKWSEFCHWIRVSHPDFSSNTRRRREELVGYLPPAPPPGSGVHRYVFLAFTPANGTRKRLHITKPSGRVRWGSEYPMVGVRDWAHENGLVPFAANFITARNRVQ